MRSPRSGNEVPSPTHSFDAGTASGYFALQASLMGWYVHGMVGFDADRAFEDLSVPKGHKVEAVYAVSRKPIQRVCRKNYVPATCPATGAPWKNSLLKVDSRNKVSVTAVSMNLTVSPT
jgi:nitroreductase